MLRGLSLAIGALLYHDIFHNVLSMIGSRAWGELHLHSAIQ